MKGILSRVTRMVIGAICILTVLSLPCRAQTQHYDFTYPDRTSFLAAGWDFLAVTAAGATRNTEQTTGAVVSYDVAPGVLQIPVDSGDLWGSANNSRNTVFRSVPTDWTSMRLSLSFAPTTDYQQVGLVAYQDDDNYVNITRIFNGSNLVSLAVEQGGNAALVSSAIVTATSFYLRLDRDTTTNTITGSYSLDGTTWIAVGSKVLALNNPQLAIFAGASPSGFPNANISWAEYDAGLIPLAISSVSLTPQSVTGGASSQGTVTLNGAAPAGGAVVTLGSSNVAVATVPASVTVAAGQTTATFSVTTAAVTTATTATITASYSSTSANTTLTANPASSSLTEYDFTYPDRTSFLAAGWDFLAVTAAGATRNTEQTTGAVVSYDVAPGVLQIPVDSGDLWGSANNSRNTVFRSVPTDWTSMRLSLSFAPTTDYQQVGLVAYQDDDNYVNITRIFNGSNLVSLAVEQGGNAALVSSAIVTATSFYLRLDRDPTTNTITGYYSLDNSTWTQVGSTVLALNNPQLAIFAGASPGGLPNANISWAQVGEGSSPLGVTLGLNPSSVAGGSSSQGTVTLSSAAPTGGAAITLGSSNAAVAAVPASVTVAAGQTTATFSVTTSTVTTATPATITASYGSSSGNSTLTVNPAPISSVSLNPTSVTGGTSSQGTVTLSSAAPIGGAVVTLGSSATAATVPASVTVAAGQTTATFTVTTTTVTTATPATITATYGGSSTNATLTVNPATGTLTISSVSLNPTSVTGGTSSQGTVTLSAAAPTGGAVVTLGSSATAATVPTSVTVVAGQTTATFTVTTTAVTAVTSATITATYGSSTGNAVLAVNPATISSVSLNPTSVTGGLGSQGTVTLSAAAPTGGAVVTLGSSNAAAVVPASVTVAAGQTTATFSVTTTAVTAVTSATITATYGSSSGNATLTLNPAPVTISSLLLSPTSVTGGTSSQGTVTLSGAAPTGGAIVTLGSSASAATVPASVTVAAGQTTATFSVTTATVTTATPATITATYGSSVNATLTVNPASSSLTEYDFTYPNRTSFLAAGWDFLAVTAAGASRNTEQTTGAVVSYDVAPGVLQIPVDSGDLWGSANNSRNTVFRSVPTNWTSMRLSLSFAPTTNYQQVGLVAYQDDDNYVNITRVFNSSNLVTFVTEQNANANGVNSVPVTATSFYLRLDRDLTTNTITGYYSLDNSTWTQVASTVLALNNPQLAIFAGASPGGLPNANISWAQVVTGTSAVGVTLGLNPSSVVGGSSSQGTVTLSSAAPTGGAVVTLGSSNAAAVVPASVTVAAGQTTATFSVTTTTVTTATPATITATYGSSSGNAVLTVNPVTISSVSLSPTSVTGGLGSQGTVTLSAAAPTGGAVVTLGSSNAAAVVPASVTVAAGQTTATFSVTTTAVTAVTSATITATYGSSSGNATLTLNPAPVTISSLLLSPTSVTGGTSSQGTVTLSGAAPTGGAIVTLGSSASAATVPASVTVAAGQTTATFSVTTATVTTATPATITATYGSSVNATLTVNPASSSLTEYDFTYPNRTSFLAAGWDFLAVTAAGASRNTEQTTGAVVSYDVAPGVLQIPVDSGDLWGSANNSRNTVFRSVPTNWTSMRLSLSFAPTTNYQQVGLVAYQDDDNYVNITRVFNSSNLVTFVTEQNANANGVNSVPVTATSFYLRLDRDLTTNTITGYYSLDNSTWTQVASTVLALNNPQLAIFAGASPSGLPNANISWAQVVTGTSAVGVTLGLNPSSVVGGSSSQGTVTLSSAAPTGGAVVTLGSSASVATVPASVTVAAGQTTATFSVTTTTVTTATPATITATYGGSSGNATLTVNPVTISSVSLNPTSVTGGTSSQGTVTLSAAAPTGGAVVTLGSSATAATVPTSVTVVAGQTTATFTVTTTAVTAVTSATITATYGSSTGNATLTLNPVPLAISSLLLNPSSVTGGTSSVGTVTLNGAAPTGGATVTLGSSNTSVATVPNNVKVAAGQTTATFSITTKTGNTSSSVTITASYSSSSGNAVLTVNPTFAYERPITVTNTASALTNYQIKITLNSSNMSFSHANSDGSDVRLRASDGVTNLPYWIESWNSSAQTATLWVNASSVPSGTSTLYLVYGNSSATTAASGANTFLFFDDFTSPDPTPDYGYMQESAMGVVNMGAAQAWEGSDEPHFFSVVTANGTIDGKKYTYFVYYGVHDVPGVGIGLAGSNDMVNWTKYSGNPVIPADSRAPSVLLIGSNYYMAYETDQKIGYATSTNGINWTVQSGFVNENANKSSTPHLWQNPNDSNYYLYWSSNPTNTSLSGSIMVRKASTIAGLQTATDTPVWNNWVGNVPNGTVYPLYAPHIYYDAVSSSYLLMFESQPPLSGMGDTNWDVVVLRSSSPTSGFSLAPGNSYHPGGYACPENYVAGTTLYTYYCYNTGSTWQIRYTTASVTAGRQAFSKPKGSLWTHVEPSANTQSPSWFLTPCTNWAGVSSQCLKGFGRFGQAYNGQITPSYLASSYSGTNYVMEARLYPIDSPDALVAVRMAGTNAPGQAFNSMLYYGSNALNQVATPGSNQISSVNVGSVPLNTWYHLVTTVQGTTMTTNFKDGASTTSGTSSADTSGSVGPGLDMQSTSMFDNIFVHQYTATVPTNSVGSEQSGSF